MKLYINSTNNLETVIRLNQKLYKKVYQSPRDQDVWGAIYEALNDSQTGLHQISEIEVATGPGSFTGIRVGISIAQTLSFCLDIPINSQSAGTSLNTNYGQKPSINLSGKN